MKKTVVFLVALLVNVNFVSANTNSTSELFEQKSMEKDIQTYKQYIQTNEKSVGMSEQENLALSMGELGYLLSYLKKEDEAMFWYDRVISKYQDYDEIVFKEVVAVSLYNKAFILINQEKYEEAFILLTTLKNNYKNIHSEILDLQVSNSNMAIAELEMMTDKPLSRPNKQELLDEHKSLFDMLVIINSAKNSPQDEAIENWKQKNQKLKYSDWTFELLEKWAKENAYQEDKKARINKTLGILLGYVDSI